MTLTVPAYRPPGNAMILTSATFRRLSADSADLKLIFLRALLINLPVDQAPLLPAHAGFYGAIQVFYHIVTS